MKTKLEDLMTTLKLNKFLDREEEKENCKKTWLIILAVIGAVLGAGAMILGSVFTGLVRIVPRLLAGIFSSRGFAVGIVIGLLLYFRNHRKNTAKEAEATRETADTGNAAAEEIIEAPRYRTF